MLKSDNMSEIKYTGPVIFDSHAHYDDKVYDEDLDRVVLEMKEKGVVGIVNNAVDYSSAEKLIEFSKKYDIFYTAVGVHPETLYKDENLDFNRLKSLAQNERVVAIGEIGLDYYWDSFPRKVQIKWFEDQIVLAKELDLPVIVHDREAHNDTLEILKKHQPKGVVHCFSGSTEMAKEILKLGMYIGIGGVVTFKNARKLVEVAQMLPMDRLLLETDAPYLSPVPFRGKRCTSDMIFYTAEKIAEIKNITIYEVCNTSLKNIKTLFNIE